MSKQLFENVEIIIESEIKTVICQATPFAGRPAYGGFLKRNKEIYK